MNRFLKYLLPICAAALLLTLAGPANAQKVGNPGTFNFKLPTGLMKVKTTEFSFDESDNINFNGTVDANGNVSIPTITFPTYPISASGINATVRINVVGPTTGTLNPLTGAVSIRLKVWIKIDGIPFGGGCRIASASSPIDVNTLVTGTSGSKTGTPYNPSTGTMRVVNETFSVPSSSDCGPAAGTVNSTVGLPSSSGNNSAELNLVTVPKVNRGITPALTATPSSGTAPLAVTLSASGSTFSNGPATYRWDFTNNGSIDQTTSTSSVSHTYTVGGTQTARVQVADEDGDVADATRNITVSAFPDLGITADHDAPFRVGNTGTYKINLNNSGYAATSGAVTVSSTLPAGLTYNSVTGTGWGCSAVGQNLTCSRSTAIGVGANAPELGVNVAVGPAAYDQVEPQFTVAATGDNGAGNNSVSDPTEVRATDLKVLNSHPSHAMLVGPDPGNVILLAAENVGDAASDGPTVITDELPAGLTPVTATGTGWNCAIADQLVTCTYSASIAPGATTDPVTVTVDASLEPGSLGTTVTNDATVTTADDLDSGNDTASDSILILDGQDVGITKSHSGDFTAGAQAHYSLTAKNFGTAATTGPTTITDELPLGLTFVAADGGPEWSCSEAGGTVTCDHANPLAAGATAPAIDLTVFAEVESIPSVSNTATVATVDDPNPANDSSTDDAVVQAIDLTVTKSHESVLRAGQQGVYTLDVQNVGESTSIDTTTVTDDLPAGLDFVSVDGGPEWTCSEATGTVTCDHAGLLAGGEQAPDITLTVDVQPAAAPEVVNTALVSTQDDFNPANDSSTDTGTVVDVDASIAISRTGTFRPGNTGTYLISVENIGVVDTSGDTVVSAVLPAGLDFISAIGDDWTCDETAGTVTCTRTASLEAESAAPEIALRVLVTPAAAPGVSTTATVTTAGDRFPDNDSATDVATIVTPDLSIGSDHEGPFRVGGIHSYDLTVVNVGSGATVGSISVTDTLPAGFNVNAAYGSGWSCNTTAAGATCERLAALAPAQSAAPITVEVVPTAAALPAGETSATVSNSVAVATAADGDAANNQAEDETDLIAVDLGLAMSGPPEIAVGAIAEYAINVTNQGSAASGPARVTDTVPAGFTPRPSGGDGWLCSSAGSTINCSYDQALAAGESAPELTVRALAGAASAGSAENAATVAADHDVVADNDSATVETAVTAAPDLEAGLEARTQAGGSFRIGTDGGYNVTVRNRGTAPASGETSIRIDLPAGINFLGLDSGQGWSCESASASVINCEQSGVIDPGEISRFSFLAGIGPATADSVSAGALVTDAADFNGENDAATELTAVTRTDLALTRSHTPGWAIGASGNYKLEVTNSGSAATAGPTVITENLPPGTTYASSAGEGWSCSASGRGLRCENQETIPAGEVSELGVTLDVGPTAASRITAMSIVHTDDDADVSNDRASDQIEVAAGPVTGGFRAVRILTRKTTATESGIVTVWLSCPVDSAVKCRGTFQLKSAGKVRINRGKRTKLNLGKTKFAVAPGRKAPVRVRLKTNVRKALVRNRKIRARASAGNQGGLAASTGSILIKAGK